MNFTVAFLVLLPKKIYNIFIECIMRIPSRVCQTGVFISKRVEYNKIHAKYTQM